MPEVNLVVVLVATALTFVIGAVYYVVLGARLAAARGPAAGADPAMSPATFAVEILRCLVLAAAVAILAALAGIDTWAGGVALGLLLWIGFPAVLWTGAIVHERTAWRLAAIHAGDWLVKLLAVGVLVGAWQ